MHKYYKTLSNYHDFKDMIEQRGASLPALMLGKYLVVIVFCHIIKTIKQNKTKPAMHSTHVFNGEEDEL